MSTLAQIDVTFQMVVIEFSLFLYHWNLRTIHSARNSVICYFLLLPISCPFVLSFWPTEAAIWSGDRKGNQPGQRKGNQPGNVNSPLQRRRREKKIIFLFLFHSFSFFSFSLFLSYLSFFLSLSVSPLIPLIFDIFCFLFSQFHPLHRWQTRIGQLTADNRRAFIEL